MRPNRATFGISQQFASVMQRPAEPLLDHGLPRGVEVAPLDVG